MVYDVSPFSELSAFARQRAGTHFSHFYQSRRDIAEVVAPFIAAGLRGNQRCLWVTAEPLGNDAALESLGAVMPEAEELLNRGHLEIVSYDEWYRPGGGAMDAGTVVRNWLAKEDEALAAGYSGLRVTGNTFWLETPEQFADFAEYEALVHSTLKGRRIVCLCSYNLDKCSAATLLDVIRNHDYAVVRRDGAWQVVESASVHAALAEELEGKKRMLAEIHHRVNNNLQVVSSLLTLNAARFGGPESGAALEETLGRIKAMALVHEHLYRHGDGGTVSFGRYLRDLSTYLTDANRADGRVEVNVVEKGDRLTSLPIDLAIPLGIASAEAMTNAFKHAFPGGRKGRVTLTLAEDGPDITLTIADDGPGFERGRRARGGTGAGLALIEGLARQAGGTAKVEGGNGGRVTFRVPRPAVQEPRWGG